MSTVVFVQRRRYSVRKLLIPSLVVCWLAGQAQQARAADEPKDIIAKAIKAEGGEDKLAKLQAGQTKSKGKIELLGGITFTQEVSYQMPGKFKEVLNLTV